MNHIFTCILTVKSCKELYNLLLNYIYIYKVKYAHFNNKYFTNSVEICLILITKFAKLIQF